MTPYDRRLQAAQGYLALGLPHEAHEELEDIEPEMRTLSEVLMVRVQVFQALGRWEALEAVARQLCRLRPDEAQWPISLAYAARRAHSLERAVGVLMNAVQRFDTNATIHYNLACYEAQLGNLDLARGRLQEAFRLAPGYRRMALDDPDLAPLWTV